MILAAAVFVSSLLVASTPSAQVPPRDQPPHVEVAVLEAQLKAQIDAEGLTVERAVTLAMYQEKRGAVAEAEATLRDARKLFPIDLELATQLARHYVRRGNAGEAIGVLEEQARLTPEDRSVHYMIATYYEEIVRKGASLSNDEKRGYAAKGVAAADRAIAIDATFADALTYKNILLRHQARLETDPAVQRTLLEQADALRAQAMELQKHRQAARPADAADPSAPAPPPPAPTHPPCERGVMTTGQAPVRVGGNIQPPTKIRDVRPVYPMDALMLRAQGVVIIEATIDVAGRVAQACVLRSIPMLDEAALDAVSQWEFTPTLLNGAPVPVIMTVTVNFSLK